MAPSVSWVVLGVVALLGGAAGSLVTGYVMKPGEPASSKDQSVVVEGSGPKQATAPEERPERSDAAKLASLERRISLLTAALARRGGEDGADVAGDDALDPAEVDVADPVFEAAVLDIFDREQERKESERQERRQELRAERSSRFASRLTETLSLHPEQQKQIAEVVTAHFDAMRSLRDDDATDRPVTRREWRKRIEGITKASEEKLGTILTPQQMSAYKELDPEDQISFGFGRRGRGGNRQGGERSDGNTQERAAQGRQD